MSNFPDFADLDDWFNVSEAVRKKEKGLAIAFAFYAPKNRKKLVLLGIPAFCHTLLCECDPDIARYEPIRLYENRSGRMRQAAQMFYRDGRVETWVFAWEQPKDQAISFKNWNEAVIWKSAEGLENKKILISNWIRLRAFMAAARGLSTLQERRIMHAQLDWHSATTMRNLVFAGGADYGLMAAEVGHALAMRRVISDLENKRLSLSTVIGRPT